jgi:hypothetical protein
MIVNVPLVNGGASMMFPGSTAARGFYMKLVPNLLSHYPGMPDYRTLRTDEVRYLYDSLRSTLESLSAPRDKAKK